MQYAGDVLSNLLERKTGADIFKPSSSIGDYVAAGLTALIPGSGIGEALDRNVVTEGILSIERRIKKESNSALFRRIYSKKKRCKMASISANRLR